MSKEIKFNVKLLVDGKETLVQATTTTKNLQNVVNGAQDSVTRLRNAFITLNQGIEVARNLAEGFSSFASSLNQASTASAKVSQLTGLTGDALNKMQAEAKAVADTFGEDFNSVVQSANALAKAFGISAEEAMKLVKDGMVSGANANGEFIDTLKEYPRYFKEAGLSAEDFIAITANAAKQGVFSDKGVDAIKEGNLRIREMTTATASALEGLGISATEVQQQLQAGTTTTFEVMQRVAEKLKELPASSSAVGTALADIFGGPGEDAGIEYIKSLADVNLSLDDLKANADESSKSMEHQMEVQTTINTAMNKFNGIVASVDASTGGMISILGAFANQAAVVGTALLTLTMTIQKVNLATIASTVATKAWAVATKVCSAVALTWRAVANFVATGHFTISTSAIAAAGACTTLKMAIRGLMCATVVGAVLAALGVAIEALSDAFSDGADSAEEMKEKMTEASKNGQAAIDSETDALNKQKAAYALTIEQLKNFHGSKSEEKKIVNQLNDTYGETMGYFKSVSEWYQALVKNSEAYCDQMVAEAEARRYANQIAEIETNIDSVKQTHKLPNGSSIELTSSDGGELDAVTGMDNEEYWIIQQENRVKQLRRKMADAVKKAKSTKLPVIGDSTRPDLDSKNTKKEKTRYQILGELIDKAEEKYVKASVEERAQIANNIQKWKEERSQIELLKKQAEQPLDLDSLEDINDAISYQQELRKRAGKDDVIAIDKEIERLEGLKQDIENAEIASIPDSELSTYEQLSKKLSYYNALLSKATTEKRPEIQKHINDLNKLKETWDELLAPVPESIDKLDTTEKLDNAISYYEQKLSKAQLKEVSGIQEVIDKLKKKREAYELASDLPDMQREASDLQGKGRKGAKSIGYEGAMSKIGELRKKLEIPDITDEQKQQLEGLISVYKDLAYQAAYSFDTLKSGWSSIKGIGSSITSMTEALEGNGNAWEKVQSIVDGVISLYESISGVIAIIDMLTSASKEKNKQDSVSTTTTVAETAATVAHTAALVADTEASVANRRAKGAEAIASAAASGAKLPYPANLAAIAKGVAAVIVALAASETYAAGSFSTGGIVGGGSPSGDKLIAHVNSGEMILNRRQQQRMLDILNGASYGTNLTKSSITPQVPTVTLDTDGLRRSLASSTDVNVKGLSRIKKGDIYVSYEKELRRRRRS